MINGSPITQACVITQIDDSHERHNYAISVPEIQIIDIKFLNKEPNDTKLNQDGGIVEDLLIVIDQLQIDHVDLTDKINKISIYRGDQGQVYRTFNYITFNGSYQIKIHRNLLYTEWLASYR